MRRYMRWRYLARAPGLTANILLRGRHDFTFDLMSMHVRGMPWKKRRNLMAAGLNLFYRRTQPWAMPIHMQLEVTTACNLRCPVCPTGRNLLKRQVTHMDLDLYSRVMKDAGPYLQCAFLWGWGEPLLNPEFPEFVRIARSYGVLPVLSTNGQNLDREEVREGLMRHPPEHLIVAIDGLTDETNSVYRVGAKLAPVLEGVRRLAEAKRKTGQRLPILNMRYIVMKQNQHELPQVKAFARENGFDTLALRSLSIIDDQEGPHQGLLPDVETFRAYTYDGPNIARRSDYVCQHAFNLPAVFADGTVTACDQDFNGTMAYGRVGTDGTFRDIWFSQRAARVRKTVRNDLTAYSTCRSCPYQDRKTNACTVDLFQIDPQTVSM